MLQENISYGGSGGERKREWVNKQYERLIYVRYGFRSASYCDWEMDQDRRKVTQKIHMNIHILKEPSLSCALAE